jgi:hypothetical protein
MCGRRGCVSRLGVDPLGMLVSIAMAAVIG